jgi:UDP-glucose 4-epimerase
VTEGGSAIEATVRRACVTGGAGFIGSHLVDALRSRGIEVAVLDDLSSGRLENLSRHQAGVELIEGSVTDPAMCAAAVHGCDLVFHLASRVSVVESMEKPALYRSICEGGTRRMLEAAEAAGVRRLIHAGSCSVYGDAPPPIGEDASTAPTSPYAAAKLEAEEHCRAFAREGRLETVCPRFFNVYGPRQRADSPYAGVIAIFAAMAARGEAPVIFGTGEQTRDFIHISDIIGGLLLAGVACDVGDGQPINLGSGRATSILELAEILGCDPPRHEAGRSGEIVHSLADTTRARRVLGFESSVELERGLQDPRLAGPGQA